MEENKSLENFGLRTSVFGLSIKHYSISALRNSRSKKAASPD
jgi:hypothetical protein